ncbi:MAG: hypothetical protein NTW19_14100 [Planctomycetota bacterium]|nr:hypothetical protein [Planctomycetota bacterium]
MPKTRYFAAFRAKLLALPATSTTVLCRFVGGPLGEMTVNVDADNTANDSFVWPVNLPGEGEACIEYRTDLHGGWVFAWLYRSGPVQAVRKSL